LEKRRLGQSEMEISVITLGAWAYGKAGWGKVDDQESIRTIREAIDSGVNMIDTAKGYGNGYSEEIVGKGVKGRRHQVFLASKCGASPKQIKEDINLCLKRMKIDYIDLYQVHYPNPHIPISETMGAMAEIQKMGKIRYIGVSNFSVEQMREALKTTRFESCQPPYNIFWREIEDEILPFCREHNIGVITYSPLAQGLLTGKFTSRSQISPDDIRSKNKLFQKEIFEKCLKVIEYMKEIAVEQKKTLAQLALNWVIHQPGITSAIVGAKRPSQLRENLGAVGWKLTSQQIEEISRRGKEISKLLDYTTNMWGYKPK